MKPSTLADIFAGFRVALPMDVSVNPSKRASLFCLQKGASFGQNGGKFPKERFSRTYMRLELWWVWVMSGNDEGGVRPSYWGRLQGFVKA